MTAGTEHRFHKTEVTLKFDRFRETSWGVGHAASKPMSKTSPSQNCV